MIKKITIALILMIYSASAQSGITFYEFAEKIQPYFVKEQIEDIQNILPQGNDFSIWGWDVGDFSDDKNYDLAMAIYIKADKKKRVKVYYFVDIDGYMTKVNEEFFDFIELPLEVGIVVKKNVCYVTQKQKQFAWTIFGYNYNNGVFSLLDQFQTERIGKYTKEDYLNYSTLQGNNKIMTTKDGAIQASNDFLAVPAYKRGKKVYKGDSYDFISDKIDYVVKGSYYWSGGKDLSLNVKANYDEEFLYLNINVVDDSVVPLLCDSCKSDEIEVWLDMNKYYNKNLRYYEIDKDIIKKHEYPEMGIFKIKVNPGNFKEILPIINLVTVEHLDNTQKSVIPMMKASSNYTADGYNIKLKIPNQLLALEVKDSLISELGFVALAQDVDNEFRPEETTEIASCKLDKNNPFSYGKLFIIPLEASFGSTKNILAKDLNKVMNEYGY